MPLSDRFRFRVPQSAEPRYTSARPCPCPVCVRDINPSDPNVELLNKTYDRVETVAAFEAEGLDLDEVWDQRTWAREVYDAQGHLCGTAMCFAGHAVVEAGHTLVRVHAPEQLDLTGRDYRYEAAAANGRPQEQISTRAAYLLGLNAADAGLLFGGGNSLRDLREIINKLTDAD